ncbi:MAG: glucose-6-phosphate dehydrogenase, partial [Actinomycetota bacterium]|nr:glucose-6-phosphate dehydrogenase [Actinomycetota bacterium]
MKPLHTIGSRLLKPRRVARDDRDHETFRNHAARRLQLHTPEVDEDVRRRLCANLRYLRGDVTDPDSPAPALAQDADPVVVYLALPHTLLADTLRGLAQVGVPQGSQLIIETPFGTGLHDARRLNEFVHTAFPENPVFR